MKRAAAHLADALDGVRRARAHEAVCALRRHEDHVSVLADGRAQDLALAAAAGWRPEDALADPAAEEGGKPPRSLGDLRHRRIAEAYVDTRHAGEAPRAERALQLGRQREVEAHAHAVVVGEQLAEVMGRRARRCGGHDRSDGHRSRAAARPRARRQQAVGGLSLSEERVELCLCSGGGGAR